MAPIDIPPSGLTLHDPTQQNGKEGPHTSIARSAVLLRLNENVVQELKRCSQNGDTLRLLAGKMPVRECPITIPATLETILMGHNTEITVLKDYS